MAIAFVTSGSNQATATVLTITATAATGSNNTFFVIACYATNVPVTSTVTDSAGNTYTKLVSRTGTSSSIEIWATAPKTGASTAQATISLTASLSLRGTFGSYSGVEAFGTNNTAIGSTVNPSIKLTTNDSNNWAVGGISGFGALVPTALTGNLREALDTSGNASLIDNTAQFPTSVTISESTAGGGNQWAAAVIEAISLIRGTAATITKPKRTIIKSFIKKIVSFVSIAATRACFDPETFTPTFDLCLTAPRGTAAFIFVQKRINRQNIYTWRPRFDAWQAIITPLAPIVAPTGYAAVIRNPLKIWYRYISNRSKMEPAILTGLPQQLPGGQSVADIIAGPIRKYRYIVIPPKPQPRPESSPWQAALSLAQNLPGGHAVADIIGALLSNKPRAYITKVIRPNKFNIWTSVIKFPSPIGIGAILSNKARAYVKTVIKPNRFSIWTSVINFPSPTGIAAILSNKAKAYVKIIVKPNTFDIWTATLPTVTALTIFLAAFQKSIRFNTKTIWNKSTNTFDIWTSVIKFPAPSYVATFASNKARAYVTKWIKPLKIPAWTSVIAFPSPTGISAILSKTKRAIQQQTIRLKNQFSAWQAILIPPAPAPTPAPAPKEAEQFGGGSITYRMRRAIKISLVARFLIRHDIGWPTPELKASLHIIRQRKIGLRGKVRSRVKVIIETKTKARTQIDKSLAELKRLMKLLDDSS